MFAILPLIALSAVSAQYIQWFKNGEFAKSTAKTNAAGMTTLSQNETNAQFQYNKLISDATKAPLFPSTSSTYP